MKGRAVALDQVAGRRAAALLVDGALDDLIIDPPEDGPPRPGTIFRGQVDRPIKGQGGVFLKLPEGEMGFLRQPKGLSQGQAVLVQVTGYAEPGKAIPLTLRLLFKSKYAIVTPGAPGRNVSRQIRDEERRAELMGLAAAAELTEALGLILRSDAAQGPDPEIAEDIEAMANLAEAVLADGAGPPERLFDGADAHALAWRDWGHPGIVETEAGAFEHLGVLDAMVALRSPETPLSSGGSLIVEPTRALIAVDVNAALSTPAAGLKTNLAAVEALPRALRLRGLGGQIVIDMAPMAKKDRRAVEQAMKVAFRRDPIETTLVGWTPLGHVEAQRKRERAPLDRKLLEEL